MVTPLAWRLFYKFAKLLREMLKSGDKNPPFYKLSNQLPRLAQSGQFEGLIYKIAQLVALRGPNRAKNFAPATKSFSGSAFTGRIPN